MSGGPKPGTFWFFTRFVLLLLLLLLLLLHTPCFSAVAFQMKPYHHCAAFDFWTIHLWQQLQWHPFLP
jgi:hypothetical protein